MRFARRRKGCSTITSPTGRHRREEARRHIEAKRVGRRISVRWQRCVRSAGHGLRRQSIQRLSLIRLGAPRVWRFGRFAGGMPAFRPLNFEAAAATNSNLGRD
ncbi:hypothetical protein ACQR1I_10435 [Bradyrhizobium sp. HKCCYLS2038]|uniref:hypothetical protein n=1 Tax=unclassified Bradyrhizobium TaxID=2631580 RepID=UPI003EBC916C